MERRALIAVVLSIAILVLYQEVVIRYLYPPRRSGAGTPATTTPEATPPPAGLPAAPLESPAPPPVAALREAPEVTVETDLYKALLTAAGGRLRSFELKKYREAARNNSPLLQMIVPGGSGELPLALELRGAQTLRDDGVPYEIRGGPLRLTGDDEGVVSLVWNAPGIRVEKKLRFRGNRYAVGLEVHAAEVPAGTAELGIALLHGAHGEAAAGYRQFQGAMAVVNGKRLARKYAELEKGELLEGEITWAGHTETYFLQALVPLGEPRGRLWLKVRDATAEARFLAPLPAGGRFAAEVFLGPKDIDVLEEAGHQLHRAIDFGYFAFIAVPLLRVLKLSHRLTGNYGVDIILLTIAIKVLFIPLTQKSFQSMREMQKLQPQIAKLRERLKDKPEQLNREIMELYRRHKVNPLGGCLPMILQIPVFIGLYNALLSAIELRHAPFALWISDLSQPDRLGQIALPLVHPPGIPVLTLLMGASMLAQQWMTPSTGDPVQQRMMMLMPLLFTFMFINFPSGLVLYWLVNNVLTIGQQYYMTRFAK